MKINWGTGIVMAFVLFISFILYFVIRMGTDTRADHELVTEEYYVAELGYQKEIDAAKNTGNLPTAIQLYKTPYGLEIKFPESLDPKKIEGSVTFYRPSNKQLDFTLPIRTSNSLLPIPHDRLLDGRWDISIKMVYGDETYLQKHSIRYIN
ncbi:MAG: FixH family protein [Sediminicola sp.]